jgi:hypothetical protein
MERCSSISTEIELSSIAKPQAMQHLSGASATILAWRGLLSRAARDNVIKPSNYFDII